MQLAGLRHRNLVSLLGYSQEGGYQMLVFEYLPNGSISNHLYGMMSVNISVMCLQKEYYMCDSHTFLADTGMESSTRLEFKQRLSIALGAARGNILMNLWTLIRLIAENLQ